MSKYTLAQLAAIYTVYKDLDAGTRTVNCCTCGKSIHIEQIEDCYNYYGHYIARSLNPKLRYNPYNTYAQCVSCNMDVSNKDIDSAFDDYVVKRYGSDFKTKLQADDKDYDIDFYKGELVNLSTTFPELKDVVGMSKETKQQDTQTSNDIIKQWNTFSNTYKQDLDELTKLMRTDNIEYERF